MTNHEQQAHIRDPHTLRRIEEAMAGLLSDVHGSRIKDMVPAKVDPSPNPKPTSQEALNEITMARANLARVGLRTGPLTDEERVELGLK